MLLIVILCVNRKLAIMADTSHMCGFKESNPKARASFFFRCFTWLAMEVGDDPILSTYSKWDWQHQLCMSWCRNHPHGAPHQNWLSCYFLFCKLIIVSLQQQLATSSWRSKWVIVWLIVRNLIWRVSQWSPPSILTKLKDTYLWTQLYSFFSTKGWLLAHAHSILGPHE